MTIDDASKIFLKNISGDTIVLNSGAKIDIEKFLEIGFKNAPDNPTKQDLFDIDKGEMGYAELIESGNYS